MNDHFKTKADADAGSVKLAELKNVRVGIIGLGYVGLPLAVYMARHFPVVGFDVNKARVGELAKHRDRTGEVTDDEFAAARTLSFTADLEALRACNFYVVTVPTPIDEAQASRPQARLIARERDRRSRAHARATSWSTNRRSIPAPRKRSACRSWRSVRPRLQPRLLRRLLAGAHQSGRQGAPAPDIIKVTSGSTPEAADSSTSVYGTRRDGRHPSSVSSIKVAEAAKVIENTQRDVNIALINELAMMFKDLGIDTREVLEAAGTKWNFLPFRPGLVGGHCIGVDPYYLTHKARMIGYHPQMILAGRRINDGMAAFVARDIIKTMLHRKLKMDGAKVLVMGFTFKENVPDTRNTKVVDLVRELGSFLNVVVYDPVADRDDALREYGIGIVPELPDDRFQAVVLAVKHREIMALGRERLGALLAPGGLTYDITGVLAPGESDARI